MWSYCRLNSKENVKSEVIKKNKRNGKNWQASHTLTSSSNAAEKWKQQFRWISKLRCNQSPVYVHIVFLTFYGGHLKDLNDFFTNVINVNNNGQMYSFIITNNLIFDFIQFANFSQLFVLFIFSCRSKDERNLEEK